MVFQYICSIIEVPWLPTLKLYVVFLTYINQLDLVLIFIPRQKDIWQCFVNSTVHKYSRKRNSVTAVATTDGTTVRKPEINAHLQQRQRKQSYPTRRFS